MMLIIIVLGLLIIKIWNKAVIINIQFVEFVNFDFFNKQSIKSDNRFVYFDIY